MPSPDGNNISERQLVQEAAVNQTARERLRKELQSFVIRATNEFMRSRGISKSREDELIEVGMSQFDSVFNIYLKNGGALDKEEGHFYAYYIWWMRQAIVAHLKTQS